MASGITLDHELYAGLQAIADSAFPRECGACGRAFESADDFVRQTEAVRGVSGLKQSWDDDDRPLVELYRNCPCGSTMMEFFGDRRDSSPAGLRRRERFGALLDRLVTAGVPADVAREELLLLLRGQPARRLAEYGVRIGSR